MKRLLITGLWLLAIAVDAQVVDAFQGVLPVTDAKMKKSLNGEWNLKVVDGITDDKTVPQTDDTWKMIPVPGCWESYGFCKPTYHHAEPLTGYYRTRFTVPQEWKGQRIIIRFDGVLYGYDLWINGKAAGEWRSGFNTAMFDITDYLTPPLTPPLKGAGKVKEQELAMRVISQFRGSDFDYNDDWQPNGIFRDVTLMAVPKTHLKDLTINTRNDGTVDVKTEVANGDKNTKIRHEILDAQGKVVSGSRLMVQGSMLMVDKPNLWTAETPYLYTLRTILSQKGKTLQTFEHKFGFRELTIADGKILKLNGQPFKLRGVNVHSTDPKTGKVISEASILRDMKMMKEASINYFRLSHYPREPRFYELADSLGFYIIDEVPFGYGDKNLSDSTFYPVLQQRAQATIRRDKNHPSVLIWSLGNENPLTDICIKLGDWVKRELDPSRPICYPQVGSYFRKFNYDFPKVADIYAPHYPSLGQLRDFYQKADRPVIFTEYLHTLGISFEDHDRIWETIERMPWIAGGSVWEWADQGMEFRGKKEEVRGKMYGYEEKVYTSCNGGFEMNGNQGTDGLVYADRTPLPNYYELQHNYARAFVKEVNSGQLTIANRYDFLNLKDNVTFHWALTNDRDTVKRGAFSPDCAPHATATYQLQLPEQTGISLLHFDVEDAQGHTFLHQSFVLNKPKMMGDGVPSLLPAPLRGGAGGGVIGDAKSLIQEGPLVRVGRKMTLAENLKVKDKRIEKYLQPLENRYVKADVQMSQDGTVDYTLTPDTTDTFLSELGVAFLLSPEIDRVQWIGNGPFATYPGRNKANRYGFWAKHMDDIYFEGNRMGIDAALFSDKDGNGLLVVGDSLNINFEQTDRGIVMTVNAAVSGQGPKSVRTAFPVISKKVGTVSGQFRIYRIDAATWPKLFSCPQTVPAPFRPYVTQYDTYLMRYEDITE